MSPTIDEIVREHGERLETLERGHLEVIATLGAPPDPSRGTPGTGMAGTLSQVAIDVREIRARRELPSRVLRIAGMVLAVAVPLSAALVWAAQHLRYSP
jgi:hypothetical protein